MKKVYETPSVKKQANLKEITKCDDGSISNIPNDPCKRVKHHKHKKHGWDWCWPWW